MTPHTHKPATLTAGAMPEASGSPASDAGRSVSPLRVLMALPGLHRVNRGAEVAFELMANELARLDAVAVTLIGSGREIPGRSYEFVHAGCAARERFERLPKLPVLRGAYCYEELTFAPGLWRGYDPSAYDVTVTCAYPFTNWLLRAKKRSGRRPAHVYVTQNGDWPARAGNAEYRWFGCEGLVCTNPEYYEHNKDRWPSVLIPNGVDADVFHPPAGDKERERWGLPADVPVVLIVSALIPSKRVAEGIRCVAEAEGGVSLVVAGDGPLRDEVERVGHELLGDRFQRLRVPRERMPGLYRCADVFLHMSMDEPSANAYIEALASGLPIVTHDRAVTRWTLEDVAVLVDTTDERAVIDGIGRAMDMSTEGDVARRRELVERRFTWKRLAGQYAEFFREVVRDMSR